MKATPALAAAISIALTGSATAGSAVNLEHNGSGMHLDVNAGRVVIAYEQPRYGLAGAGIMPGSLLFEGRIRDGVLSGTAFTFKRGCAPAAYQVEGRVDGPRFDLVGAAPRRAPGSCAVIRDTMASPHAVLPFVILDRDTVVAVIGHGGYPNSVHPNPRWESAARRDGDAPASGGSGSAEQSRPSMRGDAGSEPAASDKAVTGLRDPAPVPARADRDPAPLPAVPRTGTAGASPVQATSDRGGEAGPRDVEARSSVAPARPLMTFDTLLDAYLSERTGLGQDDTFVQDFARFTRCGEFRAASSDEFAAARFRSEARTALTGRQAPTRTMRVRFETRLGAYDFEKSAFDFDPVSASSPRIVGNEREQSCGATHPSLPTSFFVLFSNADLVRGLPMAPDEAEALLKRQRQMRGGSRDVTVEMTVQLDGFGNPMPREETILLYKRYFGAPVKVAITDMAVFETASAATPLVTLSDERKQRYAARSAAIKAAEAEDRRLNRTFTQALLAEQIAALRKGEDLRTAQRTRMPDTAISIADTQGSWTAMPAPAEHTFTTRGSDARTIVRFANHQETGGIPVPDAVRKAAGTSRFGVSARPLYVPTGLIDDDAKGEVGIVAHIVAVEFVASGGEGTVREAVPLPSQPVPFRQVADERGADRFDLLGITLRDAPADVQRKLQAAFGDTLTYDEAGGILRSASPRCGGAGNAGNAPSDDASDRCILARFGTVGRGLFGGETRGLVQVEVRQTFKPDEIGKVQDALTEKYGTPRAIRRTEAGAVAVWGSRIAERRDGELALAMGLYAVEWEMVGGPRIRTRFRLSDPLIAAGLRSRDADAAPARF